MHPLGNLEGAGAHWLAQFRADSANAFCDAIAFNRAIQQANKIIPRTIRLRSLMPEPLVSAINADSRCVPLREAFEWKTGRNGVVASGL